MSKLYSIHKMLYKKNRLIFSNNIDFNSIQILNIKKNNNYPSGNNLLIKNNSHTLININSGSAVINMTKLNENEELTYIKADSVNVYNNYNYLICNNKYILYIYPNVLFNINSIYDCNINIYSSSDSYLEYFNYNKKLNDIEYIDDANYFIS